MRFNNPYDYSMNIQKKQLSLQHLEHLLSISAPKNSPRLIISPKKTEQEKQQKTLHSASCDTLVGVVRSPRKGQLSEAIFDNDLLATRENVVAKPGFAIIT